MIKVCYTITNTILHYSTTSENNLNLYTYVLSFFDFYPTFLECIRTYEIRIPEF